MTIEKTLHDLKQKFDVVDTVDFSEYFDTEFYQRNSWLNKQLIKNSNKSFSDNQRIVFVLDTADVESDQIRTALSELYQAIFNADISNFFVVIVATEHPDLHKIHSETKNLDPVPVTLITCTPALREYSYNSKHPLKVNLNNLKSNEKFLLMESKTFCIYPWIHIHAYPTGDAYPCCMSEMQQPIGNCKDRSLEQIWNDAPMRDIRRKMIVNEPVQACVKCYEQEAAGFLSGRQSANKHHGHHITRVDQTADDGSYNKFELIYWDIRFSNLCNLSCRSCGHIFSSSWYQDQVQIAGPDWAKKNRVLNIAGRNKDDMWQQLMPHLDYVEQIYFAGGEPLMMEEHYNILDELERRGRFDVRLIYNTNFTQTKLKDREVFDYWRRFKSVAVGASLDAQGPRAEYIRKGTDWSRVERNRRTMQQVCPNVDFYISPTLSILNALHLPDFHRDWVEKGLIQAQDLNVNILQDPAYLRIDIATPEYKQKISEKFQQHLEWLRPLDQLNRATVGFESAIKFMQATDNQNLISKFWTKTQELDAIRNENILDVIPELTILK